jgi:hypothetical protein
LRQEFHKQNAFSVPKYCAHDLASLIACLNFSFIEDDVCLHSMDCCVHSGVTCDTHVSSPVTPYHRITHGMFSIYLTKSTMNVSRFHVSCIQETDYRPHFTYGGLLDFLEHCKHRGQCVNLVRLSANCVCAFQKNQQTLHACASYWPQRCSANICKRNLFCGYAS